MTNQETDRLFSKGWTMACTHQRPETSPFPRSSPLVISYHMVGLVFPLLTGDVSFLCLVPSEDCAWLGGIFFLVSSGILRKHKTRSFLCRKV